MSSYPTEYMGASVNAGGCTYASLQNYNQGYYGRSILAPVPATTSSMETVVVPSFGSPGYNVMSGTGPVCAGYPSIVGAYPNYPAGCSQFTSRLCG